jgi:hypothetical protein
MNQTKTNIVRALLQIFSGVETGRISAEKPFWTSFLDGLTGEGIFGDLRLPDAPTKMLKPEE